MIAAVILAWLSMAAVSGVRNTLPRVVDQVLDKQSIRTGKDPHLRNAAASEHLVALEGISCGWHKESTPSNLPLLASSPPPFGYT